MATNVGSTATKGIFEGTPLGWMLLVDTTTAAALCPAASTHLYFDAISDGSVKDLITATSQQSSENTDLTLPNNVIIRYPKSTVIVDGTDDSKLLTDPTKDPYASKRGEVTFTIALADCDSTTWTAMLNTIRTNAQALWLVCLPIGTTYTNAGTGTIDGYYYMLGKITTDLESKLSSTPASVTITLVSYEFYSTSSTATSTVKAAFVSNAQGAGIWPALTMKGTGATVTPPTLTAPEAALVADGELVLRTP